MDEQEAAKGPMMVRQCRCPYCEGSTKMAFPFCVACGQELRFCPACQEPLPRDALRCSHCGAILS